MTSDRVATAGTFGSAARAALLAGTLLLSAGCAERYLHNAQDSFSKGAAIENQAVLGDPASAAERSIPGPAPTPLEGGAVIYYTDARENVRKALTKEGAALEKQKLTGSAYALQALINWRLDDLLGSKDDSGGEACETLNYIACARASSDAAVPLLQQQSFLKRDRFMMAILPGLLDHNLGLRRTQNTPKRASDDFKMAFNRINEGFVVIDPVKPIDGKPTPEQAMKVYALLAQYQVLRAWSAAMDQASKPGAEPDQALTVEQRASCKATLRKQLASIVTNNINAVDPKHLVVTIGLRDSFIYSIGDRNPGPQPCPWPL